MNSLDIRPWRRGLGWLMALVMLLSIPMPALAQNNFPFDSTQPLSPEQLKVQKYKLSRLRVQELRDDWFVVRGINERLDDMTVLKLSGRTIKLKDEESKQTIITYVLIGGLVVAGVGGLLLTDILKFTNSTTIGIGLVVVGGAAAIGAEVYAGNIGEENPHLLERADAEAITKEYNAKLKQELGIENLPNLD